MTARRTPQHIHRSRQPQPKIKYIAASQTVSNNKRKAPITLKPEPMEG